MKILKTNTIIPVIFLLFPIIISAQGYLHRSGKYIYNANNQEIILRGIGTGNWMLNEGYMMRSANVAGTHTQFRDKLTGTIGETNTATFYESWLNNHFKKADLDSMKVWGFNSIRLAMHYKWLTLPIEDEPVTGQDTWFENGFIRIDTLLKWCTQNEMYLILDLHGAPGGQGHDQNISDYDPSKPSLWESPENQRKTVALWKKFAERYATEPWLGGYDLINEPNWELPNGTLLKQVYVQITNAIRTVDQNHIIFIEGNWFANTFTGLTPPWDNNMVYSFHKYWNSNALGSISWMLDIRNSYNIPIWLGETGENSNPWFTSLIALCETQKIGWSWWPVKKAGINNILKSPISSNYENLIKFWTSGVPNVTPQQAFEAVMEWSDNHKIENCTVQYDVIDAMMRQPYTTATKAFVRSKPNDRIYFANYNLGRNNYAYFDTDTANTGNNGTWNQGWEYRNDGVDIEACTDTISNNLGFNVGFINADEWMEYTITTDSLAAYTVEFRTASLSSGAIIRLIENGIDISPAITLPVSNGWQKWKNSTVNNIILSAGTHKIRVYFDKAGSNVNFFRFINPFSVSDVSFGYLTSQTSEDGTKIFVTLNKPITSLSATSSEFVLKVNNTEIPITSIEQNPEVTNGIILNFDSQINFGDIIKLNYSGNSISSGDQLLESFSLQTVRNTLPFSYTVPCKIEAENYYFNNGFQLENCTDTGGGQNTAFANQGDYLDYKISVPMAGNYGINFRYATQYSNGRIDIRLGENGTFTTLTSVSFSATGGWQVWKNTSVTVLLQAGNYTLRLYSNAGEYNINWFKINLTDAVPFVPGGTNFIIQPNPTDGNFNLSGTNIHSNPILVSIFDINGSIVQSKKLEGQFNINEGFDIQYFKNGIYFMKIETQNDIQILKIVKTG